MPDPLRCAGRQVVLQEGGSVSPSTLARQLGVSLETLARWRKRHNFPRPVRCGRQWYLATGDVGAWLNAQGAYVQFYK
jgi:predicted DNA-binding transcriptional regulator AlpA